MTDKNKIRDAYRRAAVKLFGVSQREAEVYIVAPEDDRGQNAPDSLVVIYLEADCRTEGDGGILPEFLSYYADRGMDNCDRLAKEAGTGYVEYHNAAVAAVYEAD